MLEIYTEITIHATKEKIWSVLIDFDTYSTWNPFIRAIKGKSEVNQQLIVTINPPGKKPMIFKPKVITLQEKEKFQWLGNLLFPKIFAGQHKFVLKPIDNNKILFVQSEIFSGILSKPIFKMISQSTQTGFEQMNASLKKRCETRE